MMLVLALRSDAERVYAHALTYFSEDEIAEAFAAARGVASPTQLRTNLKQDGRDLLAEFRRMAPEREEVSIQRWSVRRVLLTVAVLLGPGSPSAWSSATGTRSHEVARAPGQGRRGRARPVDPRVLQRTGRRRHGGELPV